MDRQQIGLKLALDALRYDLDLSDFERRLALQKIVYLVQAAGVGLGYSFGWHLGGPYSPELLRDAFAVLAGLAGNADEMEGWGLDTASLERLVRLRDLFEGLAGRQDLLACVHFLLGPCKVSPSDIPKLHDILVRNDRDFSEAEITGALATLNCRLLES